LASPPNRPSSSDLLPILISAILFGFATSLFGVIDSIAAADFFFAPPVFDFQITELLKGRTDQHDFERGLDVVLSGGTNPIHVKWSGTQAMHLQNRVTPFGDIVAIPQRGTFTGNRGIIHEQGMAGL